MYTIYSIGDSAFLAAIMNSIAMIAATGDYRMGAGIGALIGLMLMCLKSVLQFDGRGLRYQDLLAGFLLYLGLFVPGVQVGIEDAYTGQVRTVAQVPFGPAVAGSILSNVGYRLTVLFEMGFSTPSMSQHGFLDALQIMSSVRRNLLSRINMGKANAPVAGSDIESSVINYVKECTLTGVDLNLLSMDSILLSQNILAGLRFDSSIYTTQLFPGGSPTTVTCTDAWPILQSLVETTGIEAIEKQLSNLLSASTSSPIQTRLQSSLDALTQGQVSAVDYMLSATLTPMFEKGIVGRHEDGANWSKALMVQQAIQQRATQWAAEQTLFTRIVRPMMAWIEGFGYAITPLMAFIVLLGARGIQMMGQYGLMLIWIQLWMPILAIINLYINLSAIQGFSALNAAQFHLPSIEGIYQMDMEIQNWLSVGGLLASSTPGIALMLVYGGSITATHFLSRMQSGDYVDEKIMSPALIQSGGLINITPRHQHTPLDGTLMHGAEKVLPSFQMGHDLSDSVSSSRVQVEQSAESFMKSLGTQAGRSHQSSNESFDMKSLSHRLSANDSETDRFITSQGQDFSNRFRDSGITSDDFSMLIGGALSGSIGQRGGVMSESTQSEGAIPASTALQAGLSGQLQNRFHLGKSQADEIALDMTQRISADQGFQTELARSIAQDAQTGIRSVSSLGMSRQDLSNVQSQAQDLISASNSFQENQQTQTRFASTSQLSAAEVGLRIATSKDSYQGLKEAINHLGLKGDAQQLAHEWHSLGLLNDRDQSYAAAGVSLLTGHSHPRIRTLDAEEQRIAESMGHMILGEAFKAPYPDPSHASPELNRELIDRTPVHGAIQTAYEQTAHPDPMETTRSIDLNHEAFFRQQKASISDGAVRIESYYEQAQETRSHLEEQLDHDFDREPHRFFKAKIQEAVHEAVSPAEVSHDWIEGFIHTGMAELQALGGTGIDAFLTRFNHERNEGKTVLDSIRASAEAFPETASTCFTQWLDSVIEPETEGLTRSQKDYYRAEYLAQFSPLLLGSDYSFGPNRLAEAREGLRNENPEMANDMAGLIKRAAGSHRPDLLSSIKLFNRTQ